MSMGIVDVVDVAKAHLLAMENPAAQVRAYTIPPVCVCGGVCVVVCARVWGDSFMGNESQVSMRDGHWRVKEREARPSRSFKDRANGDCSLSE